MKRTLVLGVLIAAGGLSLTLRAYQAQQQAPQAMTHVQVKDNLYLINGSSGHGVMHAPALGQLLAEIVLHGAAGSLDVTALRPERFAEGRPNVTRGAL